VKVGKENNCHEFMGYIFIKAIEDLNDRLGPDMVNNLYDLQSLELMATWKIADHEV